VYDGIVLPFDFVQLGHIAEILVQLLLESCVGYPAQRMESVISALSFSLELRGGFQFVDVDEEEVVDVPKQVGKYLRRGIGLTKQRQAHMCP